MGNGVIKDLEENSLDQLELGELLTKANLGDEVAYALFLEKLFPKVNAIVSKRTKYNTEDISQEILISVHQARATYDPSRPFFPWLYAIANFRIADQKRSYWRNQRKIDLAKDFQVEEVHESVLKSQNENLIAAVNSLPDRQREIVKSLKFDGYSIKETAHKLNTTVAAVKVSAHRAYEALRILLTEEG